MHNRKTVLTVDLGAESGRVMAVHFDGTQLVYEELHRFANGPVQVRGTLYWDVLRLWQEIQTGIEKGKALNPASIGVDTWGVDFALLDAHGTLLGNPVHYRDSRTDGMRERVEQTITREALFARTGSQYMPFNTIYQLMSMVTAKSPQLAIADTVLMMPDLINYWLTGEKTCEYTIASTTQLLNPTTKDWDRDLMQQLGIPAQIFPKVVQPGTQIGSYEGIPVIVPACHDTASAVAAIPATTDHFGYISSGTWSLVGLEVDDPLLTDNALSANITNEGGVNGTIRLLKNVIGMWILQQCRAVWRKNGNDYDYNQLVQLAQEAPSSGITFDVDDPRFMPPGDHTATIRTLCDEVGAATPQDVGAITRLILESLAAKYTEIFNQLNSLAGQETDMIHIIGGGSQNDLLNQFTANATGIPVQAGPVEATVLGNALVQLISLGEITDLAEGRALISQMDAMRYFEPESIAKA